MSSVSVPWCMALDVGTLPITVGVGGFLVRDDRLLVVRKTYGPWAGQWTIPSGYIEPGESVAQTIEREVAEETGVVGRAEAIVAVRNLVTARVNDTFLVFTMSHVEGEPTPDRKEVSDAAFLPVRELVGSAEAAPFTKAMIARVPGSRGFRRDDYAPPKSILDHQAYLLYVEAAKDL